MILAMNPNLPETALPARIQELEQQLRLAEEGASRLAQRCLEQEQELEAMSALSPQMELHENSPLLLPKLFYDAGFGLSEQDSLSAPMGVYDERTAQVTVAFELPAEARLLRLDPGELPCCVAGLTISDERLRPRAANGIPLGEDKALFLRNDPNLYLEGLSRFPAGMQLVISYQYYPLETLAHEPLFCAVLDGMEQMQRHKLAEQQQQAESAQQLAQLRLELTQLRRELTEQEAECRACQQTLEQMRSSSSWRLTAPLRRLGGMLRR